MDFRLSNVGSISVDPHKYGRSPKGCSVIMFKHSKLKSSGVFVITSWNAGLYGTPSLLGSRPANAIIGAWIAMNMIGLEGLE